MCRMQTLGRLPSCKFVQSHDPGITGTSTYVPHECRLLFKSTYLRIPLGQGRPSSLRGVPTAPSRMGHHGALDHYSYAIQQYLLAGITNVFETQIVGHPIDYLSHLGWQLLLGQSTPIHNEELRIIGFRTNKLCHSPTWCGISLICQRAGAFMLLLDSQTFHLLTMVCDI